KGIELTDHAKYLLPTAEKIVRLMDNCEAYFASGMGKDQEVSIILTWGAMEEFAQEPIAEFKRRYPDIYINIRQEYDMHCEAAEDVAESELAMTEGPIADDRFDARLLYTSRYGVVVRKNHRFAGRESINIKELDGIPIAMMREYQKTYSLLSAAAEAAGAALNVQKRVNSALLTYQYANLAQTIGISTKSLAARFVGAHLRFVPFDDPGLIWTLYLIKRRDRALSAPAATLERTLLEFV
ncbi:MAG: LysR family transcriptional regulator substrate-binding protein, partial [Oscillospiraceae bacterium]|nr:LysR family transcriptional regulator substrate-binding protein [Oscillospiraceae bacterium]